MKREQYLEILEQIKKSSFELQQIKNNARDQYIDANKPFPIDTEVMITLSSGRKVTGFVKGYGILSDGNVYVTSYKDGSQNRFITVPYISIYKL